MNWAIINGEKQTGATMFYIDEGIDSGDVIAQKAINIGINDDAYSVGNRIESLYADLLTENYFNIVCGTVNRLPQNHKDATYTCKRTPEDGLIDWGKSSFQIYNLVRGLVSPYPNAFSYIDGKKVNIVDASLAVQMVYSGRIVGRVIRLLDDWVEVLTGDGSLLIKPDCKVKSIKTTFRSC